MKICLIGPSHPFRGGIAHHTTLLYRHLRKKHDVRFYAFKRQYPRWLFPGKTDVDPSRKPLREEGVERVIDSINPVTWWKVVQRVRKLRPDLVIFPWWTFFWTAHFWIIAGLIHRISSAKILFICHNVTDHESHPFSSLCTRIVLNKGDFFLVHSAADGKRLQGLIPSARITYGFHPVYDFFNNGAPPKVEAKTRLGLSGDTILFFGFVRPYKGLDDLLKAMPLVLKDRKVTLLIVGEFWNGTESWLQLIKELEIEQSVRIVSEYVPNEKVGLYFSAADLVVLPYKAGTGSGIGQIAHGFAKPVVATRVGSLADVVEDGRTGFLVDPGSPADLANAIVRFFREGKGDEFEKNMLLKTKQLSWEKLTALIDNLMVDRTPTAEQSPGGIS